MREENVSKVAKNETFKQKVAEIECYKYLKSKCSVNLRS